MPPQRADYEDMLAALGAAKRFGVRLDLAPMQAALARLGSPETRLPRVVHVGGTNGKGSTSAMIESGLRAAGLRTGLYTSPHLARFTERVRLDGAEVAREVLAARYAEVAPVGEGLDLTFFEQATLLAFLTFAGAGLDAVVLEVGLGGRLDATNVVDPAVAVVTGVALDHQDVLGPDLRSIAREKAGIAKPGRPLVLGAGGEPEALPALEEEGRARGARIVIAPADVPGEVGLAGAHQRRNAACADAALELLGIPERARREGIAGARWPGRLERLALGEIRVLLDAAHNPQGAAALAAALPAEPFTAVVGVSADKDAAGLLAPVAGRAESVVATQAPSARALPAADLARLCPGATAEPDPMAAVALAAARGRLVVVYGSIFLVGAVRAGLLHEETDPAWAQDPSTRR
jgi:dihydrofolate synthase/folylpolyglutamate synthase